MSNFQTPSKISAQDDYLNALIFENAVIGIHSEIVRISLLCNELLNGQATDKKLFTQTYTQTGKNFLRCLEEI